MRCAFSWITCPATGSAYQTGGDIVCSARAPSAVRLLVGDVMGHGRRAARASAEVMRAFQDLARHPDPPQVLAMRLHGFIAARGAEEFVTALIISIPFEAGADAEIVSCGHPAPLLLTGPPGVPRTRPRSASANGTPGSGTPGSGTPWSGTPGSGPRGKGGETARISSPARAILLDAFPASPPLGLLDLAESPATAFPLGAGPGDCILLYTDGVTEARDPRGRPFPLAERAAALAPRLCGDSPAMLSALRAELLRHTGGTLADDATMLLIHLDEEPPADAAGPDGPRTAARVPPRSPAAPGCS